MVDKEEKDSDLSGMGQLYADIKKKDKQINLLKNQLSRFERGLDPKNQEKVEDKPAGNQVMPAPIEAHKWRPYIQYCTEKGCGERNPSFKDETKCTGCGMHIGGLDTAINLEKCPSCGKPNVPDKSVFWDPLDEKMKVKAREMLHLA